MKKAYRVALCGVVLSGVMAFNAFGFTPINSVAAIVNDGVITQTQLNQKMVMMKAQMKRAKFKIPSDSALKQQVLQQMIDQLLQIQAAKKMGIQISNTELNAQLSDIAKNNKISVDDLYQSVQKDGWTIESFREETREELMMKELEQRDVVARISISPQEVSNFLTIALGSAGALREYHLQRIVLALPDAPSPDQVNQVKNDAQAIFKQLKSGADFSKTAIERSSGSNALKGGNLGWKQLAELSMPVAQVVKNMKAGQVSDPIQTVSGFEIVKLLAERNVAKTTKAQRNQVEQLIFNRKIEEGIEDMINQLRGNAYIRILSSEVSRYSSLE
ncbi:MAG: peptidylprolyl isomerase [Pseudomonadota bacterium]